MFYVLEVPFSVLSGSYWGSRKDFNDTPHDKRQKFQVEQTSYWKNEKKQKKKLTGSSKNGENLKLSQNSDFRNKSGIFKLKMQYPDNHNALPPLPYLTI